MEEKVNFAIVGIFVLVLTTGLISGVLWLSSGKSYIKLYDIYQTYMNESVSGLNINAPVRYHGVQIGRVKKIALAPQNVEEVELTLEIERGTPVKMNTVAILQSQGLTGLAFIDLTGGSSDSPPLIAMAGNQYPIIKTGKSLITRLDTAATSLLNNFNKTSENLNTLMDKQNQTMLRETLTDIHTLSSTLAARSATIDASLTNASRTLEGTARLSNELPILAQRVQQSADRFDRMANALTDAGVSANNVLNNTQQFTSETLPEVQQLVIELRKLTDSLQHFSSDLERNPSQLLYGKPPSPKGPGE